MEDYNSKDPEELQNLLLSCSDFNERRKIRASLRELRGLRLDGDKVVTYSFEPATVRKLSSSGSSPLLDRKSSTESFCDFSPGTPSTRVLRRNDEVFAFEESCLDNDKISIVRKFSTTSSSQNSEENDLKTSQQLPKFRNARTSQGLNTEKIQSREATQFGEHVKSRETIEVSQNIKDGLYRATAIRIGNEADVKDLTYSKIPRHASEGKSENYSQKKSPRHLLSPISSTVSRKFCLDQNYTDETFKRNSGTRVSEGRKTTTVNDISDLHNGDLDIHREHNDISVSDKQTGHVENEEMEKSDCTVVDGEMKKSKHVKVKTRDRNMVNEAEERNKYGFESEENEEGNEDVLQQGRKSEWIINETRGGMKAIGQIISGLDRQEETLQENLKQSANFSERRRLRGEIRQLKDKREDLLRSTVQTSIECGTSTSSESSLPEAKHQFSGEANDTVSKQFTNQNELPATDYTEFDDLDKLRKLLSEATDYEEKRRIRLTLRQLRAQGKERDSGSSVNGFEKQPQRSHSFLDQTRKPSTPDSKEVIPEAPRPRIQIVRSQSLTVRDKFEDDEKHNSTSVRDSNILKEKCNGLVPHKFPLDINSTSKHFANNDETIRTKRGLHVHTSFTNSSSGDGADEEVFETKQSNQTLVSNGLRRIVPEEKLAAFSKVSPRSVSDRRQITPRRHSRSRTESQSSESDDFESSSEQSRSRTLSNSEEDQHRSNNSKHSTSSQKPSSQLVIAKSFSDASLKYKKDLKSSVASDVSKCETTENKGDKSGTDTRSFWLEGKKKSIQASDELNKLMSTMDIEAAFSEILEAVDDSQKLLEETPGVVIKEEDEEVESEGVDGKNFEPSQSVEKPLQKTRKEGRIDCGQVDDSSAIKPQNSDTSYFQKTEDKINSLDQEVLEYSPSKKVFSSHLTLDLTPALNKNGAISIISDDDGAVMVQEIKQYEEGGCMVTERTKLKRTESRTEEKETDTIVESIVTSPGGSTMAYEKDVTKVHRKITSRGSEYFQRQNYNIRRTRDSGGSEHVQHELCVDSDNLSVSKNESWGEHAEAKVTLNKGNVVLPATIVENQESTSDPVTEKSQSVIPIGRLNVSKASSGYGSVSGSDEDENQEAVETRLGRPLGCPEIIIPMKDVSAQEDDSAMLECTVNCLPLPMVTWYHNGKAVEDSDHCTFHFDGTSGKASLFIAHAASDDAGEYKCFFHNPVGEAESKASILIKRKAMRPPVIETFLHDTTVNEGCEAVMECIVQDADTVKWYKNGIIQRNSSDFRQTFDGRKARLQIAEVFLDDKGTYVCVAHNAVGEAKSSCILSILECTSTDSVVPIFLRKPENRIADEGDKVVIDCDIIGSPQPVITWQKDMVLLTEDGTFSSSYDGRVAMLIIRNITSEHSGKYECVAENPMGKISADFLVVVKELKQAPSLSEPLCDVDVDCGKSIILECVIKGNPQPTVIWRMDRHLIQNRKDSNQSFEKGRAKLEITDACPTDSGCYECVARNSQGETSTSCHVIVKDAINMDRCPQEASPFQEGVSANDKRNTHFAASFEGDHKHSLVQVKSLATKVMLVRQSSLKSVDREGIKGSRIKRSESFKPESKQRSVETVSVENVKSNMPDLDHKKNIVQLDGMEHSRLDMGKEMDSTSLRMQKYTDVNDNEKGHVSKEVESGFSQPQKSVGNEDARLDVRKVVEHGLSWKQKYSDGNEHTKFDVRKEIEGDSSMRCKYSDGNEHTEFDVRKEMEGDLSVRCKYSDGNENAQLGGRKEMDSGSLRPRKYSWRSGIDNLSIDNKQASGSSLAHSASNSDTRDITVNEKEGNNCISESEKSTVLGFFSSSSNLSGSAIESKKELIPLSLSTERFSDKLYNVSAAVPACEQASSPRRFIRRRSSSSDRLSARNSVDVKTTIIDDQSIAGQRFNGTGTPLPKSTSQVNIRRSQSVKVSQTSETPSWVGMKLKRVEGGNVPRKEIDGSNLKKETKLNRSESARLVEKPSKNIVNANKCVQIKPESKKESIDSGQEKIDIKPTEDNIPFTFKKRNFKPLTASSKETLETKEPFSVIAKVIDLSRSGSFKDNPSESRLSVNHSQSVPVTESWTPVKDVALDLTAQKFQGGTSRESLVSNKKEVWQSREPISFATKMTDYTKYTDEDELHQILQKSEDIEERRKIRARIKELRETHQKEWEEKRQQREKETEDVIRSKYRAADAEKQRKLEEFKKQAAEHHDSRAHEISSQLVQEKFKSAEEDKKKKMEAFDRMAQESSSVTTSTRTESTKDGVKTTTTTVRKTETVGGVGGTSYGKPAEETARELVQKLASFSSPTTSGTITVKTESWNSREAVIHKSEKIESWGAGRGGASGNMFKQMDKATGGGAPKANGLVTMSLVQRAATTMRRNAVTIKQEILNFCQTNTEEYNEKVNIENFSTSWNDGLAFCALIHHFYPEAFDFNKLDPKNRRHNFELAFNTAEKLADIAPLLDVEDMVRMKKPDWKCVFTYVQSFYRKLQSHEKNKVKTVEQ